MTKSRCVLHVENVANQGLRKIDTKDNLVRLDMLWRTGSAVMVKWGAAFFVNAAEAHPAEAVVPKSSHTSTTRRDGQGQRFTEAGVRSSRVAARSVKLWWYA